MAESFEKITEVVQEVIREEEALDIVKYLRGKKNISEFIIAEELDLEIHRTRNILYQLLEQNIVSFKRKKDKIKGWYICYWNFNEDMILYLESKFKKEKLEKLKDRVKREEDNNFYMCKNACMRCDFEQSTIYFFKCPECGDLMNPVDNSRTLIRLKEQIDELSNYLGKSDTKETTKRKTAKA